MTKEEALKVIQHMAYLAAHVVENGVEAYECIEQLLSQPSLPSNLDEAALQWWDSVKFYSDLSGTPINAFKAGAEWMEGKFQRIEGDLIDWYSTSDGKEYCCGVKSYDAFEVPEGFYIRKK